MRRILCVILLGGLLLTMLSGCTSREPSPESGSESRTASASEPLSPEDPSELEPHALLNWYQRMGLPTASRDGSLETWIAADDLENALRESFTAADRPSSGNRLRIMTRTPDSTMPCSPAGGARG